MMNLPSGIQKSKSGGWSKHGLLHTGVTTDSLSMQCNFPQADVYTVEFSLLGNDAEPNPIQAEALITWSVEGNNVTRRVSIGNGVSVTGVGASCSVVMIDKTIKQGPFNPVPNGSEYRVSVQISAGSRASTSQPPTLVQGSIIKLGPGVSTGGLVVPVDAGVISVYVTVSGFDAFDTPIALKPAGTLVQQVKSGVFAKCYDPMAVTGWVPVSPGTASIDVVNIFADMPQAWFSITFGIDG